ncbi:hypothetical protein GO988_09450 [Hymenobacter sp. HMF4947]|uniref:DUF1735 domain-containing protein n=1 Tax=Hymenobacter ginkgonis TaxID=2682976 RepID=A0A7K1TDR6_9BACT|nr:hypothetical protein [Hymenobacter ginkgonis]MVN76546.1 hypothetical protein [Hymenobacter ginkgonis]
MKKTTIQFFLLLLLAASFSGCKKDYGNKLGPLQDSTATIPVTVTNQVYFERFPVVTTTVGAGANANGTFSIAFSIPADKGKIKEITKVATGNSGVEYLQDARYPNYLTATIAGNGTNTITFNSDLNAVRSYATRLNAAFATLPASATKTAAFAFTGTSTGGAGTLTPNTNPQTPNQLRFFFLFTLEDGTQLISTEVDVRLL